jgi:hypothetical protein
MEIQWKLFNGLEAHNNAIHRKTRPAAYFPVIAGVESVEKVLIIPKY